MDQTVHFNTMLVRESESGYSPPGLFHVVMTGTADLTVYREYGLIARLAQDSLLKHQSNVFWAGPISNHLSGVGTYLNAVHNRLSPEFLVDWEHFWVGSLAEKWIATLCRILISIQRYRHGGALLITSSKADLDIKYRINYPRLPEALKNIGASWIRGFQARTEVIERIDFESKDFVPAKLYLNERIQEAASKDFEDEITGCVRFISSLSCVDGLILARPDLSIVGFGVEIRPKNEIDVVYLSPGPKAGLKTLRRIDPNHYGTRHRSMMRYCAAHPKSIGFVISQDGEIRAMTRVGGRLVMWENLQVLLFWDQDFKKTYRSTARKPSKVV